MAGEFCIETEYLRQQQFEERARTLDQYASELSADEAPLAQLMATNLLRGGKPLAHTIVIIPVAAHQEADNIPHTIAEYARQQGCEPFSLFLGLNAPSNKFDGDAVQATEEAVQAAIVRYPNLDLRYTLDYYAKPVIGEIRRDLWNAALVASTLTGNHHQGQEIIGINHDIDLVKLAGTYIGAVQRRYAWRDSRHIVSAVSPASASLSKHAYSPSHPNISKAVFWKDYACRKTKRTYEAGTIIPFSFYAHHGGYDASAKTYEIGSLTKRSGKTSQVIPGTYMETSPRRYVANMDIHDYDLWSGDSFSATDQCRESRTFRDISVNRKKGIVGDNLTVEACNLSNAAMERGWENFARLAWSDLGEYATKDQSRQLRLERERQLTAVNMQACGILRRVIESDQLAKRFTKLFSAAAKGAIEITEV